MLSPVTICNSCLIMHIETPYALVVTACFIFALTVPKIDTTE